MSPEAVDYISTAERLLDQAGRASLAEIYEVAARDSYPAPLSAARAFLAAAKAVCA